MNVWLYSPAKVFAGKHIKNLDSVVDVFPKTQGCVWGLCKFWTLVHTTDDGFVYMGHRSPDHDEINTLATRIMIDTNQFSSAATLLGTDNPLKFCARGCVAFYRVAKDTSQLLEYPWAMFCAHWPQFFRSGTPPYMTLEEHTTSALQAWIRVNRGDKGELAALAKLLDLPPAAPSTKDTIAGNLLAVVLRRIDPEEWNVLEL
jgi:hypothetical protein